MVVTVSFREIKLGGCIVSLNCFYECACNVCEPAADGHENAFRSINLSTTDNTCMKVGIG